MEELAADLEIHPTTGSAHANDTHRQTDDIVIRSTSINATNVLSKIESVSTKPSINTPAGIHKSDGATVIVSADDSLVSQPSKSIVENPASCLESQKLEDSDPSQSKTVQPAQAEDVDPESITDPASPWFSNFPAEILIQICKYLEHKHLIKFCMANRRLYSIVTPIIYKEFSTAYGDEVRFMETITAQPRLAKHIKRLQWIDENDTWDDHSATDYEVTKRETIARNLNDTPVMYHKQLGIACEHASGGTLHVALLAAAMCLSPNLESLTATLTTSGASRIRWNETVWLGAAHGFANLHTVRLRLRRSSSMDLNALFLLPSIRTLDMSHVDRMKSDPPKTVWLPPPPKCSNVEVLLFRESNVEIDILAPAVKACKKLKTFMYQHHGSWSPVKDIDMAELGAALAVHRDTLQHVCILDRKEPSETDSGIGQFTDMLDTFELPQLSTMVVPLSKLESKDKATVLKLPPKITSFACTVRGEELREPLNVLVNQLLKSSAQLAKQNPLLKEMTIWLSGISLGGSMLSFMARQACNKAGIQVNFKKMSSSNVDDPVEVWEQVVKMAKT